MKLFTLPFAGGSGAYYVKWNPYLNKDIELITIEYAGRGRRIQESLCNTISYMIEDIFSFIKREIIEKGDYMIFGHSMGAILALELAHKIQKHSLSLPSHIFFSGRYAPNTSKADDKILHNLPNEDFRKEILKMGGTTAEVFEHPELTNLFLPILRNDIYVVETYKFVNNRTPLNCDFSVLTGKEEDYSIDQIAGWRNLTSKQCDFYQFDGGHFFINEEKKKVVELINNKAADLKLQVPRF